MQLYLHSVVCLAISDYKNAENLQHEGSHNRRVHEGLKKAQKLLKQSQKRDYYKILGVKRYCHSFLLFIMLECIDCEVVFLEQYNII